MANTSSALKAIRSSEAKNEINNSRKNRIRSFIRKVEDAIKSGDSVKANEALKNLQPEIMKGVTKNIFTLNNASRKISRLSASIKKISNKA